MHGTISPGSRSGSWAASFSGSWASRYGASLAGITDLGTWYYDSGTDGQAFKHGSVIYGTGIRSTKEKVVWSFDGTTYDDADIYTSDQSDNHNMPSMFVDARDGGVLAAECDHSTTSDVRIYYAADGDPDSLALSYTVTVANPTYCFLNQHSGGDAASVWFRDGIKADSHWDIAITSDFTAATPTYSHQGVFEGHYIWTAPAIDEAGAWLVASGSAQAYKAHPADPDDPRDAMFWGQTVTVGYHRFSDNALLIGGSVEIADLTSVASRINLQSRNRFVRSENYGAGPWTLSGATATRRAITDRFGATDINSWELEADATSGIHQVYQTVSVGAGDQQAFSIWVKANEITECRIMGAFGSMTGGAQRPLIHLENLDTTPALLSSERVDSWGYEASPDEPTWVRVWFVSEASDNAATSAAGLRLSDGGSTTFSNSGAGLYISGPQFEVGDAVTAYIQTSKSGSDTRPTNPPPIAYEADQGKFCVVLDVEEVESGYLEILIQEIDDPSGIVPPGTQGGSRLKYIRFNTSTNAQVSVTDIDTRGDSSPHGRGQIMAANKVVYGISNEGGSGNNVLKVWDNGVASTIKSTTDDLYYPLLPRDSSTRKKTTDLVYLEGTFTDADNQSVTAKLGVIKDL